MNSTVSGFVHCPKCGEKVTVFGGFHTVSACNGRVYVKDLSSVDGKHECQVRQ